jgi:uncharacterized protein (TIGR03067 family)
MRRFVPLLIVLSLGFAPAPVYREPKPKSPADAIKAIRGKWKVISRTIGGEAARHAVSTLEVADGRWTYSNAKGDWRSPWSISLDAKGKPWRFDAQSEKQAAAKMRGVCVVEGDKLTLCFAMAGDEPPVDFDGKKPGMCFDVYQRIKP